MKPFIRLHYAYTEGWVWNWDGYFLLYPQRKQIWATAEQKGIVRYFIIGFIY
jgi:hypothetical protein